MMTVDRMPIVFVALDDAGTLVGTASLLFNDLEGDPRNPWLASVFVPAEQRGKGIASALVAAIEAVARRSTPAWAGARLSNATIAANICR